MVICLERDANDLHVFQLMPLSHLLLHYNPFWCQLTRLSWKRSC